jgi:hypothetical protein
LEERSKATEAEALAMQERYQTQLVQAMAALQDLQAEVAAVTAQASVECRRLDTPSRVEFQTRRENNSSIDGEN